MATSRQPQFVQRRMARRAGASDITRLAGDYTKQMQGITAEYESRFADYRKTVAEQMAPFDEATRQYQDVQMPAYEAALKQYQEKFDEYQRQLDDIERNPLIEQKVMFKKKMPSGRSGYYEVEGKGYVPRELPKFNETAPTMPGMPEAPKIAEFDSSEFEQRRAQAQEGFKRETAERRGARMNAVQRRGRGMLGGVK